MSRVSHAVAELGVRALLADDAAALAALAARTSAHPWNAAKFGDSLIAGAPAWCVDEGDGPCAWIVCQRGPDDWEALDLGVAPSHQRRGLARRLLATAADAARADGAKRLLLEVREGNARARSVYAAAGFVEGGRRRGYYPGPPREDALLLELAL